MKEEAPTSGHYLELMPSLHSNPVLAGYVLGSVI